MGKTHLLEGINHGLKQHHPKLQILQLTAEAFTNGFLDSMRSGTLTGFRAWFRGAGGLIVDDIQFLAAKRATMVEFLYTFNALYDKGAPIILAADQHPRQIPRLSDELVTRFVAGMVARIEPPDVVTRQAILRAKASARGVEVPEVVSLTSPSTCVPAFASSRAPFAPSFPRQFSPVGASTSALRSRRCEIRFVAQQSRSGFATSNGSFAACFRSRQRHSGLIAAPRRRHTRG